MQLAALKTLSLDDERRFEYTLNTVRGTSTLRILSNEIGPIHYFLGFSNNGFSYFVLQQQKGIKNKEQVGSV